MTSIATQDSIGMHGKKYPGKITGATGSAMTNGKKIAVHDDLYTCSKHGKQKIIATGSATVDGKKVAIIGDKAKCGAELTIGSPDTTLD